MRDSLTFFHNERNDNHHSFSFRLSIILPHHPHKIKLPLFSVLYSITLPKNPFFLQSGHSIAYPLKSCIFKEAIALCNSRFKSLFIHFAFLFRTPQKRPLLSRQP